MADFLTHLAMRIAQPLDIVRPRLPSMFEPPQFELSQGEWQQEEAGDRAIEADTHAAPAGALSRDTRAPPRDQALASPQPVAPAPAPHREEEVAPLPEAGEPGRGAPPAPRAAKPTREARVVRPSITNSAPARRASERTREPEPRLEPVREAARSRDRGADAAEIAHREPAASPIIAPVPERPAAPVRSALVAPRTRFDEFGEPPRAAASVASEPTIHVTIGRVEVRAVTAPPRGPAKPASSPVMSLEDYLRTRAR
jgi:hypothetical protein